MVFAFSLLTGALKKASEVVGTLPAVCCALAFWLGVGAGNLLTRGHLDPGYTFSNWFMNGTGFVMLFILAYTARLTHDHVKEAKMHAAGAHLHAKKVHDHLKKARA